MKIVFFALIIASAPIVAYGQESAEFKACSGSNSAQSELNRCASEEALRVDKARHAMYQRVEARFRGNAIALTKLIAEEKAWVLYRDAYVAAMYPAEDKQAEYGSMYPMEVDLLIARLTREHIKELQAILEDGE